MLHPKHKLVQLANGQWSLRCEDLAETYHPVIGPESESDTLYAQQIHLERISLCKGPFVVWDVGLGGAANALAVIKAASSYTGELALYSFEHDLEPLALALSNEDKLPYLAPFAREVQQLLNQRCITFQRDKVHIRWEIVYGDFPQWLAESSHSIPAPAAILYDAFSPKKNPDMYTLSLFQNLRKALDDKTPCLLASYSRATLLRATFLLSGFYVGKGAATGEKEETTVAANVPSLIQSPLDASWLARAERSTSAEPLHEPFYLQKPLSPESWALLQQHPQFRSNS